MNVDYILYSSTFTQDFRFVYALEGLIREEREKIKRIFRNHYYRQEKSDHYDVLTLGDRLIVSRYFFTGEKDFTGRCLYGLEGYVVGINDVRKQFDLMAEFLKVISSYSILRKKGCVELDKVVESKFSFDFDGKGKSGHALTQTEYDIVFQKVRAVVRESSELQIKAKESHRSIPDYTFKMDMNISIDKDGFVHINERNTQQLLNSCNTEHIANDILLEMLEIVEVFDRDRYDAILANLSISSETHGIAFEMLWHMEGTSALAAIIGAMDISKQKISSALSREKNSFKSRDDVSFKDELDKLKKENNRLKNENEIFKRSNLAYGRR